MDPQQLDLPPPKNWQDFQDLCHALWELEWKCPTIQKNGRTGQRQRGVDIFGQPHGNDRFSGIQCKVKSIDAAANPEISEKEVQDEVDQAKSFIPPLEHLIVATTAPEDAKIQTFARELTGKHSNIGLFTVDVLGWPEMLARLVKHEELLERFYPGGSARWKHMATQVGQTQQSMQVATAEITAQRQVLQQILAVVSRPDADRSGIADVINKQIDRCRELMDLHKPSTAIQLLEALQVDHAAQLNDKARFRIITNIGAAKLHLDDRDGASEAFLQAWSYAKGDEKADSNRAFGLLLQKKIGEARAAAQEAKEKHPSSGRPIAMLIMCAMEDRTLDDPLKFVPTSLLDNHDVMYALAGAYRFLRRGDDAVHWGEKVYVRDPSSKNRRFRAESLLTRLDTPSVTIGKQLTPERKRDLETARSDLEACWAELKTSEEAPGDLLLAATLVTCLMLAGDNQRALDVATEALAIRDDFEPVLRQAAILATDARDFERALQLERRLHTLPERGIMIAESLMICERWDEARVAFDEIIAAPPNGKILQYAQEERIKVEAGSGNAISAIAMADKLRSVAQNDIRALSLAAEVRMEAGRNSEAIPILREAASKVGSTTEYADRLTLARLLYRAREYALAVTMYTGLIETGEDNSVLQEMLKCMYAGDIRDDLDSRLASLPAHTLALPFYVRIKVLNLDRIGRRNDGFALLDRYLEDHPDDLRARLHWVQLADDLDLIEPLNKFLEQAPDLSGASPRERMAHAQLLKRRGFVDQGLRLGYELLRHHSDEADVHLGFIGLVLQEPHPDLHVKTIDTDTAFKLDNGRIFIVEQGEIVDATRELPPHHHLVQRARGAQVGDEIVLAGNAYQEQKSRIVEVLHKYALAFREAGDNFQFNFPGHEGLMLFSFGKGGISEATEIAAVLRDQAEGAQAALAAYDEGAPICLVAPMLGHHPIRTWQAMIQAGDRKIRCAFGTSEEKEASYSLLQQNKAGFLVDPLTIFVLHMLGAADCLIALGLPVGVTTTTFECLQELRFWLKQYEKDGLKTLSQEGDKPVAIVVPAELVAQEIQRIDAIINWIGKHCDRVDATGSIEISADVREALKDVHPAFIDSIRATSGSGRVLVADDLHYRQMAKLLGVERSVGLEFLIWFAAHVGAIEFDTMATAIESMILANYQYVSLDDRVLRHAAEREGWKATPRLRRLLGELGRQTIEISSAVNVAIRIIAQAILTVEEDEVRSEFTQAILDAFAPHFSKHIPEIKNAIVGLAIAIGDQATERSRRAHLVVEELGDPASKGHSATDPCLTSLDDNVSSQNE